MRSELRTRQEVIARRLALLAPRDQDRESSEAVAPEVPVVGRHAESRRWLPVPLRGPAGLEPWHGVLIAALAVVVLAGCCWWLLHRAPQLAPDAGPTVVSASALAPVAALQSPAPAGAGAGAGAGGAGGTAPSPTGSAGTVMVDVAGKVRRPGVHTLPQGARVIDALRAAGGVRRGVDLAPLNQARVLVDGEQILVGVRAPPGAGSGAAGSGTSTGPGSVAGALINLNTASAEELDTLPGVGPVTAQSILDYRTQHGGFSAVAELLEVDGIGAATLAKLEPHVTV
jgi:competence protein ComEA